jgi:hypothetical protein
MTGTSRNRYLSKWLDIGKKNFWIRQANDPPFNSQSFHECKDEDELLDKFDNGRWTLGQAFFLGEICFVQQVDGGDEWLAIKQDVDFDSISFGAIIKRGGREEARALIQSIREATVERCRSHNY